MGNGIFSAKKSYECSKCKKIINPGERYRRLIQKNYNCTNSLWEYYKYYYHYDCIPYRKVPQLRDVESTFYKILKTGPKFSNELVKLMAKEGYKEINYPSTFSYCFKKLRIMGIRVQCLRHKSVKKHKRKPFIIYYLDDDRVDAFLRLDEKGIGVESSRFRRACGVKMIKKDGKFFLF